MMVGVLLVDAKVSPAILEYGKRMPQCGQTANLARASLDTAIVSGATAWVSDCPHSGAGDNCSVRHSPSQDSGSCLEQFGQSRRVDATRIRI